MSLTFQKQNLDGHTVRKAVDDLINSMKRYDTPRTFGKNLQAMTDAIPGYATDPNPFTYGGGDGGVEGGYGISFTEYKRDFVEAFCQKLSQAVTKRVNDRFSLADIAVAIDIFDRRRFSKDAAAAVRKNLMNKEGELSDDEQSELGALKQYGNDDLLRLAAHFRLLAGEDDDTVLAEWQLFKVQLAKLPEGASWESAYSLLKIMCEVLGENFLSIEVLLDCKAVIIWATVCCERGFSPMKIAKGELQASMLTAMLDARLRIQILGPKDHRKLTTAEKTTLGVLGFKEKVDEYNLAIDELINRAIVRWGPTKHQTVQSIANATNGAAKLGKAHKKLEVGDGENASRRV